jgi:two-component system, NarL family, response regulator NreC
MGTPIRLVLADDHVVLREALKVLLEQQGMMVVAHESDGQSAVDAVKRHSPDVAILDVLMPGLNGLDAAREIARLSPPIPVILLSAADDARWVPAALHAGVRGFVSKIQASADLIEAIAEVRKGRLYVSPGASQAMIDAWGRRVEGEKLTPREQQVLQLIGDGKSTREIAEVLHISVKTAEFHRAHLMKKLDVHDAASLMRRAIREGWITP